MAPSAVVVSYRLGGDDGVAVEARKWTGALQQLGFATRRVAGRIEDEHEPDDVEIPGLAIDATAALDEAALRDALVGADLVIVENLCSLPLNLPAARATARALESFGGRVCFHHHDLPWQRRHLAHLEDEFPPRIEGALHLTVNLRSRRELEARGYASASTVHNRFDLDAPIGNRDATRAAFGFEPDDLVLFQPARAIERKNVPGGIRFAMRLRELMPEQRVQYWLSGPAEDGYQPTLDRLLERAEFPITLGRAGTAANAYAASDVIVYPSTWEGFGNPTIESIAARRPCAAFPYPVLTEILSTGVRLFSTDAPEALVKFLRDTDTARERYYDVNLHRARLSFSLDDLASELEQAFHAHGWLSW